MCGFPGAGPLPQWSFPFNFTGLFLQSNRLGGSIPADWKLPNSLVYLQVLLLYCWLVVGVWQLDRMWMRL